MMKKNVNNTKSKDEKNGKIPMWIKILLFVGAFALSYALRDYNLIAEGGNWIRKGLNAVFQVQPEEQELPEEIVQTLMPSETPEPTQEP